MVDELGPRRTQDSDGRKGAAHPSNPLVDQISEGLGSSLPEEWFTGQQ